MVKLIRIATVTLVALGLFTIAEADQQQQQSSQGAPMPRTDRMDDGAAGFQRSIEDRVFSRLAERDALWNVDVEATQGRVTLSGSVPSESAKRRAVRIARQTPGVRDVNDQIRVQQRQADRGTGQPVADDVLAQRVAQKIAAAVPGAKAGEDWWGAGWRVEGEDNLWNMVVQAEGGSVWLEGDVPRYDVIRKAVQTARDVEGVRSVRSELEVEPNYARYGYPFYGYGYPYYGHPYAYGPYGVPPAASPRTDDDARQPREKNPSRSDR